jgi:hypothetical protein
VVEYQEGNYEDGGGLQQQLFGFEEGKLWCYYFGP